MTKELRASNPDKQHPLRFQLKDLFEYTTPERWVEIHIEFDQVTKVPIVVVTSIYPNKEELLLEMQRMAAYLGSPNLSDTERTFLESEYHRLRNLWENY